MDEGNSSPLELRRLWPSDKEAFRDHLLSLELRSRHMRFGGGMSDDFLVRYAENCFGEGDLVYGAFVGGRLVGAGELRSERGDMERAGAVRTSYPCRGGVFGRPPHYRRRGVGEKLFKRILRAATNHGIESIEIICLPETFGMFNLAKKFHAEFAFEQNWLTGRLDRSAADRVLADPRGVERRARFRGRFIRRPLASGGGN